MKTLVSFDGFRFEDNGFYAGFKWPGNDRGFTIEPQLRSRVNAGPALAGANLSARTIPVEITYDPAGALEQEDAFDWLMGELNPEDTRPRKLVAVRMDDTLVETMAVISTPSMNTSEDDFNWLAVTFTSVERIWRVPEADATQDIHTTAGTSDLGMPLDVTGQAPMYPLIILKPTAPRTVNNVSFGWKYQRTIEVGNLSTRTYHGLAIPLGLGNTTGWSAQADGDDVLILDPHGRVVPRTLIAFNTASSFAWIILNDLDGGESRTYYVVYGNTAATNPETLTYPLKPACDINNTAEDNVSWAVNPVAADAGLGGWSVNTSVSQPTIADRSVPMAWRAAVLMENADDYAVAPYRAYVDTAVDYWGAFMDLERGREDARGLTAKGLADTLYYFDPRGIKALEMDYTYYNAEMPDTSPATKFRKLIRGGGAEDWEVAGEDSAVHDPIDYVVVSTTTFSAPYPTYVALALLPFNEERIPKEAAADRYGLAQWATTLNVDVDDTMLSIGTISAEEDIYDLAGQLYLNAFQEPFQQMALGGFDPGAQGRLMIPIDDNVVIDCATQSVEHWNAALTSKLRDVADGAVVLDVETIDGVVTETLAFEWFPIRPKSAQQGNMSFVTDIAGWTKTFTGAGVTATEGWDNTIFGSDSVGSLAITVSVNPLGINQTLAIMRNDTFYPVVPGNKDRFTMEVRTNNTNLRPFLGIRYYADDDEASFLISYNEDPWTAPTTTWVRRVFEAVAPDNAAYARLFVASFGVTAGVTGTDWFDRGRFNKNDLTWSAFPWDGTLQITVQTRPGYF